MPLRIKTAMKTVSATISAIALPPTSTTRLSEVFMPTAAMPISNAQPEIPDAAPDSICGTTPVELIAARIRKTRTKPGKSGGRLADAPAS